MSKPPLHKKAKTPGPQAPGDKLARIPRHATLRRQLVLCGKSGCRKFHGPYWYAAWRHGERVRTAYVGSHARLATLLALWGERADTTGIMDVMQRTGPPILPRQRRSLLGPVGRVRRSRSRGRRG